MDLWFGQGLWAPDPRPACDPPGQGGLEEEGGRDRRATERGTRPPARQTETLQPPGIRPRPADGTEIRALQARRGNPRNQTQISPATFFFWGSVFISVTLTLRIAILYSLIVK